MKIAITGSLGYISKPLTKELVQKGHQVTVISSNADITYYLQRSVEIVGIDRILFSADYPYQYREGREARNFLEATELSK